VGETAKREQGLKALFLFTGLNKNSDCFLTTGVY
jgi:hypothetical protein